MMIRQGHEPDMLQVWYFGPVADVTKDLKNDLKTNAQVQIAHANDPETLAQALNAEQVIKHLMGLDLAKLPVYPKRATGDGQAKFGQVSFYNQISLSIRGEATPDEPKHLNILLPNGVRLD